MEYSLHSVVTIELESNSRLLYRVRVASLGNEILNIAATTTRIKNSLHLILGFTINNNGREWRL